MSSQEPRVRGIGLGELAGTIPTFIGYGPGQDDVVVAAVDGRGMTAFMANIPDGSWDGFSTHFAVGALTGPIEISRARHALIFGYGEMGQVRALALKATLSGLVETKAFRVSGDVVREVDYGFAGQWEPVTAPNPRLAVDVGYAEPAADRSALVERYGLIEDERVTDQEAGEADVYATLLPNNAGARADRAWALLENAGPGSSGLVRSRIAALIAESVQTRDALMGYLLAEGAPRQDNLEYVARTANDSHLAQVSATTAACLYFNGGHRPVGADVYVARAEGENLAQMVDFALETGMRPTPELRASMKESGLLARDNPAVEETGPAPQPRITRPSIDGASGSGPSKQGPSMGLG